MEEAKSVIGVICSSYDSFFDSEDVYKRQGFQTVWGGNSNREAISGRWLSRRRPHLLIYFKKIKYMV